MSRFIVQCLNYSKIFFPRPVSLSDIQATEKRLLQTLDMILAKKKRIALAKKGSKSKSNQVDNNKTGWWGVLRTVTAVGQTPSESILLKLRKIPSIKI